MRKSLFLLASIILMISSLTASEKTAVLEKANNRTMTFTKNMGQWGTAVQYRSEANGAIMWFSDGKVTYQFLQRSDIGDPGSESPVNKRETDKSSYKSLMIEVGFVGSNPHSQIEGLETTSYRSNYFIGSDQDKWFSDVPNYNSILYRDIYPGIDLKYYGSYSIAEYDFIVGPDSDPSIIKISYEGVNSLEVDSNGRLVISTSWGNIIEEKPLIFQETNGVRKIVAGQYELIDENSFSFRVSKDYDRSLPLTIDPVLNFSTYFGGTGDEYCIDVGVDIDGNPFLMGYTNSSDFPVVNGYQETYVDNLDVFVTKFDKSGSAPIYSTYLGGLQTDNGFCMAVDLAGNAYLSGKTVSTDFPSVNPYQATYGGGTSDIFVSKIGSAGNTLEYSTYFGGTLDEDAIDMEVDNSGHVYLAGRSKSTDFPTVNAYQPDYAGGTYDGIIIKLAPSGDSVVYSTYLGGTDWEFLNEIALDPDGNVVVVGGTSSTTTFPLKNAYQTVFGGGNYDICLTKLGVGGDSLIYSTFLGGSGYDVGYGVDCDLSGNAYIIGNTGSTDFPTQNPYQASYGGGTYDVFISKLSNEGTTLEFSTYMGGSGTYDVGYGMSVSESRVCITGYTTSLNFPTKNPYQPFRGGGADAFLALYNSSGDSLLYSTYFGGGGSDYINGVIMNNTGDIYMAGYTSSVNFPLLNAHADSLTGGTYDAFLTVFDGDPTFVELIESDNLPDDYFLSQNYPNPFNPTTEIQFSLPSRMKMSLDVFNSLGQRVKTLHNGLLPAGSYSVTWDGTNAAGNEVASGIYLYRLTAGKEVVTRKMVLMK